MKNYIEDILKQLIKSSKEINEQELKKVVEEVDEANHIFLAGAGRSGLAIKGFANRLMHLGYDVSVVGEISSPHSKVGDLLIICSSSGETKSLVELARKAKKASVKLLLVTTNKKATISKLADVVLTLPGKSKLDGDMENNFIQPMGSDFEQLAFITFDSLVLNLMDKNSETSEEMLKRHADFE